MPPTGDPLEEDGIHRLPFLRHRVHEEVREENAPRGDPERHRHEDHRPLRAVRTFGSRMIVWTPFETASMPVYVPPPSEYARTNRSSAPIVPSEVTACR